MNALDGVKNFLQLLNENWITILCIVGLIVGIVKKTKDYFSKNNEERIEIAKKQIHELILKVISDAENEYSDWSKAGSIKRSQAIKEIYEKYPILSKAIDQDALVDWIDTEINNALKTLREIVKENK